MPEDVASQDSVPRTPSSDKTASFVNGLFRRGMKVCRKQHDCFKEADKFVDGEQWDPEDEAKLKAERRPTGVFNFVKRHVNVVSGVEILNRLGPQFLPRVLDEEMADRLAVLDTGCYDYVMENCDGSFEISSAFRDLVVRAMGFLKQRLDLMTEPGGQIVWERVDGLQCVWDPDAMGRENLAGSRFFIFFSKVPKKEVAEEWPAEKDYINSDAPNDFDSNFGVSAKVEQVVPPPYDPINKYETDGIDSSGREHVIVKEAYWYVDEDYMEYVDPFEENQQPQIKEMPRKEFRKFQEEYAAIYPEKPEVKGAPRRKRVFKRAFIIGGRTMEESDSPTQTGFPVKVMTGEWAPNKNVYRALPHLLKDPQQFLNRYVSHTQHSIATTAKGVLFFEDGAFENYAMAEEQWASWAPFIPMKAGAISGGSKKYEYLPPASANAELYMGLWQAGIKVIEQIAGINLEMLGGGEGEVPGITMRQRQAVAMIAMAGFFKSYRRFLKEVAICTLEAVREFYTDDRIIRIGGQYDGQAVMLQKDELSYPIHVTIDENPRNPNVQQAYYEAAAPLLPGLFKSGAIMQVPSMVDILPLPPKSKAELKAYITKMGQMIAQGGDTPGQKGQGQGAKKGSARDDPRMVEAGIQTKNAKTQETLARARMLDAETKLKQFKAITGILDSQRESRQSDAKHNMELWGGLTDLHHAHGRHQREGQTHQAELQNLMAATAALRNGNGAGASA